MNCGLLLAALLALGTFPLRAAEDGGDSANELDRTARHIESRLTKGFEKSGGSVAVTPLLTLEGRSSLLGKLLSEKLMDRLAETRRLAPLERERIEGVLSEMKLEMSGLVD